MKADHRELKQQHELAVAYDFIRFLQGRSHALSDLRTGDTSRKREPDVVCNTEEGIVGIEVADAYNSRVAETLWEHARGRRSPATRSFINPDSELAGELNRVLHEHCAKRYSVPTWLVLNATHAP